MNRRSTNTNAMPAHRQHLLWAGLVSVGLSGCATGLGSSMGTSVSAPTDDSVAVTLDGKHPWVENRLLRGPASLIATYDDGAGGSQAAEELARAELGGDNTYQFRLPSRLKAVPKGRVCLHVQVSVQSQGVKRLPVRTASAGSDTAGFANPRWEQRVVPATRAGLDVEQGRVNALGVAQFEDVVRSKERDLRNRWQSPDCRVGSVLEILQVVGKPWVIPQDRHPDEARKVCLYRAWTAGNDWQERLGRARVAGSAKEKLEALLSDNFNRQVWALPTIAAWLMDPRTAPKGFDGETGGSVALDPEFIRFRHEGAKEVHSLWLKWAAEFPQYKPLFPGTQNDRIWLSEAAGRIQMQWIFQQETARAGLPRTSELVPPKSRDDYLLNEPVSKVNLQGWMGANLDAYEECVDDVAAQFGVALAVAERTRDGGKRSEVIREQCRADWAQLGQFKRQLDELRDAQKTSPASTGAVPMQLPGSSRTSLNDQRCS